MHMLLNGVTLSLLRVTQSQLRVTMSQLRFDPESAQADPEPAQGPWAKNGTVNATMDKRCDRKTLREIYTTIDKKRYDG